MGPEGESFEPTGIENEAKFKAGDTVYMDCDKVVIKSLADDGMAEVYYEGDSPEMTIEVEVKYLKPTEDSEDISEETENNIPGLNDDDSVKDFEPIELDEEESEK